jgi:branched-chain amino acid transport system substrate-binding protein
MLRKFLAAAALGAMLIQPAAAADTVKIGVITTRTTGAAAVGTEQLNGMNLALKHLGNKMAGLDVELIVEDDGLKPDLGKQAAEKLTKQHKVNFVTGLIWSHVMMAARKPILDSGTFMISANAGASDMAGKLCDKNFFSTSWQNDQIPMASGEVMNKDGIKSLYMISPNYKAGKDMVNGVKVTFKGEVLGTDLTKWSAPRQLDFQAELAKAKASEAEALFVFLPANAAPAFLKQFGQAGLHGKIKLYTAFTVDAVSLPSYQEASMNHLVGALDIMHWAANIDNEVNKRFVADYLAEHGRYPSFYAAQAYDAINFINGAVTAVGGDLSKQDEMRAAMETVPYKSVRGDYTYGKNHFPVQNFYLREVKKDADGRWVQQMNQVVFENHTDPHVGDCKM